jgi:predicted DNA-binding transcriptional regulator AlpA
MPHPIQNLPETGFLRLPQIIGDQKAGIPPIIPISRSSWWSGVRDGRFPQPIKLGPGTTAWRVEDIRALIERVGRDGEKRPWNLPIPFDSTSDIESNHSRGFERKLS